MLKNFRKTFTKIKTKDILENNLSHCEDEIHKNIGINDTEPFINEEDEDIKLLILHEYINKKDGKKIKNKLTLGSVIVSPYANSLIKKQYTKLLNLIFEPNELNMRNNIAHINNENSDYLCLGDTAVLMQLLWDIITEDIFE